MDSMRLWPVVVASLTIAALVACSTPSPQVTYSRLATCAFDVGDTVRREGMGAKVPGPGGSVSGFGDKAGGGGSVIQIGTSEAGVVTITGYKDGVSFPAELCNLPGFPRAMASVGGDVPSASSSPAHFSEEELRYYQSRLEPITDRNYNVAMIGIDPGANRVFVCFRDPDPELQQQLESMVPPGSLQVSSGCEVEFLSSSSPTP